MKKKDLYTIVTLAAVIAAFPWLGGETITF